MRRRTALVMLSAAAAAVAVTVLASVLAALRYAAFRPLDHPFLAGLLAMVVAIVALRGLRPEGTARLLQQTGLGLLAVVIGVAGLALGDQEFRPHHPVVVASGPAVRVVAWRAGTGARPQLLLRLRTSDGLLSRDAAEDVACFIDERQEAFASWAFASATVVADGLLVKTVDGQQWRVTFDPATLRPTTPAIDRCTGAPGYSD